MLFNFKISFKFLYFVSCSSSFFSILRLQTQKGVSDIFYLSETCHSKKLFTLLIYYYHINIKIINCRRIQTKQMQAFQWEDNEQNVPLWAHMIAGSCAGLTEHLSMLPLDNVKTHCQAGSRLGMLKIIKNIYSKGGISNFYSGSSVLAMGCIPAHAIYFSIYQNAKKHLGCEGQENHHKFVLVGIASSLFHDLVMTPTQVLKQRLQLIRSEGNWLYTKDLAKSMYKNQGFLSFYRSFGVNYMMNIPFGAMIVFFNEKIKHLLNVKQNDSYFKYFICAGLAGSLASIPTCPLDVIKTKLNTQECTKNYCETNKACGMLTAKKLDYALNKKMRKEAFEPKIKMAISSEKTSEVKYRGILQTAKTIFKQEGYLGFFSGLRMRIAIQSTSSAIAWGSYQIVKSTILPESKKF